MTQAPHKDVQIWLDSFLGRNGGTAGTVHLVHEGALQLAAARNIPPPVVEAVRRVPMGKGMAGLAWERGQPVQTCNLQADTSGDVRPGARSVHAQAAVALPVGAGAAIRAVVGIAFAHEGILSQETLDTLSADAATLP